MTNDGSNMQDDDVRIVSINVDPSVILNKDEAFQRVMNALMHMENFDEAVSVATTTLAYLLGISTESRDALEDNIQQVVSRLIPAARTNFERANKLN